MTEEPEDAEAAVTYWRERWADTASRLTDAVGVIHDLAQHANPIARDHDGFVATGYTVTVNGVAQNVAGTSVRVSQANLAAGGNTFTVVAQTLSGTTNAAAASLYNGIAYAPVAVTASQGNQGNGSPSGSITLNWANSPLNVNNVTGLTLTWTLAGSTLTRSMRFAPTTTGTTLINLSRDMNYNFTLTANSAAGNSPAVLSTGHSSP